MDPACCAELHITESMSHCVADCGFPVGDSISSSSSVWKMGVMVPIGIDGHGSGDVRESASLGLTRIGSAQWTGSSRTPDSAATARSSKSSLYPRRSRLDWNEEHRCLGIGTD